MRLLLLIGALLLGQTSLAVFAGNDETHAEKQEVEGPNGGRLLNSDDFSLEITIFERGVPPEMRVFAYRNGEAVAPGEVDLKISLSRLGGERDELDFTTEENYLVSNQVVREPHSFDVAIKANYQGQAHQWNYDNYEGRAQVSERIIELSNIQTEKITAQTLDFKQTLFGVISSPQDKVFSLYPSYPGIVKKVLVKLGQQVDKGQVLMVLLNTQTLQTYQLTSPSKGEITRINANEGSRASNKPLLEVTDLSEVWVDLSAFPENIEKLAIGQKVVIYDMHQHLSIEGEISYVASQMTGGHIARARAVIENPEKHWRAGMHIKADIQIDKRKVPLAVRTSAIQSFRDMPVVFAKFGDQFEVRMLELGITDGEYIEVLGGIKPGTEYVTENSFLLKADVLKDGASHDH